MASPGDSDNVRTSNLSKAASSRSFYGGFTWDQDEQLDDVRAEEEDHTGSRFVMRQDNRVRLVWTVLTTVFLAYIATVFLYRLAFCDFHVTADGPVSIGQAEVWTVINTTSDVFFWVDLVLNFFFSYQDPRGTEVDSLPKIARHYFRFFFWINLLACLPEQLFSALVKLFVDWERHVNVHNLARVYRLQRISRLAKLTRLTRILRLARVVFDQHNWFNSLRGVRCINFIVGLFWTIHLLACFWYLVAALHNDVNKTWLVRRGIGEGNLLEWGPFGQWLTSMYFVLTVFTTVGFGDMYPVTSAEIIYVAIVMMMGAVVHSIIISEVIGIIVSTDQVQQNVRKTSLMVEAFAKHAGIPPVLSCRMSKEVGWRAERFLQSNTFDKGEMEEVILRYIPRPLLLELPAVLFGGRLLENKIIKSIPLVPPRLPCLLAVHLITTEFANGETVYQVNEIPLNIFIVVSGTFAFVGRPDREGGFDAPSSVQAAPLRPAAGSKPNVSPQKSGGFAVLVHARSLLMGTLTPKAQGDEEGEDVDMVKHPTYALYPYQLFSNGNYFGDTDMMLGRLRLATARCEKAGTALALHKASFQEIQQNFPQFDVAMRSAAARNEYFRRRCLVKLKYGLTYKNLAARRIQDFVKKRWARRSEGGVNRQVSYLEKPKRSTMRKDTSTADVGEIRRNFGSLREEFDSLRSEMRENMIEVRDLLRNLQRVSV